jgi:hypothetical protein
MESFSKPGAVLLAGLPACVIQLCVAHKDMSICAGQREAIAGHVFWEAQRCALSVGRAAAAEAGSSPGMAGTSVGHTSGRCGSQRTATIEGGRLG